ncbi:MAG: hypothetical protein MJE12_07965 [Alphaproteobacteria bacterium]|nr:hypothetical protein [Alphaproteobacteria bacterium]
MRSALKKLTTRKKQAYGALCLARYCEHKAYRHPSLDALVQHLLLLLIAPDIPEWGESLSALDLNGLGDPLPTSLEEIVDPGARSDFQLLVVSAVEIGVCDLYGAASHLPLDFALKCVEVLRSNGIEPPRVEEVFLEPVDFPGGDEEAIGRGADAEAWGAFVTQKEHDHVMAAFAAIRHGK